MEKVVDRIVVLKKEALQILLCRSVALPLSQFSGELNTTFTQTRVSSYDPETGFLVLKLERGPVMTAREFEMNSDGNDPMFQQLRISMVLLDRPVRPVYVPTTPSNQSAYKPLRSYYAAPAPAGPIAKIVESISYPINKIDFFDGYVLLSPRLNWTKKKHAIRIEHPFSKKRFDSIKKYFSRKFEEGMIAVKLEFRSLGGNSVAELNAESEDLLRINEGLLDEVRNEFLYRDLVDFPRHNIVSIDEVVDDLFIGGADNPASRVLSTLLDAEKTKHHHHLSYLAKYHTLGLGNLRVTGKPFSFIFVLERENAYYVVWETYATDEATYIWRVVKDSRISIERELIRIEEQIKMLRMKNKRAYRNEHKKNADFAVLEHDYSLPANGFAKWRDALEDFVDGAVVHEKAS